MSIVATERERHHPGEGTGDEEWRGSFFSLAVGEPLFPSFPLLLLLLLSLFLLLWLLLFESDLNDPVWSGPTVASVSLPFMTTVGFSLSKDKVTYLILNKTTMVMNYWWNLRITERVEDWERTRKALQTLDDHVSRQSRSQSPSPLISNKGACILITWLARNSLVILVPTLIILKKL